MMKSINAIPLLVLIVLGVLGVNQGLKGMGNREQGTVSKNSLSCEIVEGSVHDGDTVRVKCGEAIARIRLACIDAPELKQEGGIESRDFLKNLINKNGSTVAMIPLEQDKYDRTVAELILKPGSVPEVSIQEELLKAGQARIYEQYSDCPNINSFRLAQDIGQKNKAGVWGYASLPPWEWRKQNK
jgi:endonuclease YncB( thermonuclease family)